MMKKIRRKGIVLFPVLVCLVGVIVVSFFWLQEYRKASFEHISKFCEIVALAYYIGGKRILKCNLADALRNDSME